MVVCRQQPEMWRKHFLQDLELSFSLASETEMVVVVVVVAEKGGLFCGGGGDRVGVAGRRQH